MYYAENTHPAIMEPDVFELVKAEMQRRKEDKTAAVGSSRFTSKYAFSGLLICGECGHRYRRNVRTAGTGAKVPGWAFSSFQFSNYLLLAVDFIQGLFGALNEE